jgi:hypothetical protein
VLRMNIDRDVSAGEKLKILKNYEELLQINQ